MNSTISSPPSLSASGDMPLSSAAAFFLLSPFIAFFVSSREGGSVLIGRFDCAGSGGVVLLEVSLFNRVLK